MKYGVYRTVYEGPFKGPYGEYHEVIMKELGRVDAEDALAALKAAKKHWSAPIVAPLRAREEWQ